ncbi:ureidoglycolate lyase [Paracoccus aerodenitrificans]|uniref:ureidoglycolate lyase n=1 Tax=Paracoccus aerodenitrificans TaxID=3017781 RepID=UPI0022F0CDAB|nr:ureidoglycolate lyase [Paracoccus aerodenitrificans]WBU64262.1 ureidoglycolate lyase [Paracoccus aerodenitrificans]
MSSAEIKVQPLTSEAFAAFGDVLEVNGPADIMINKGKCGRHHDRAKLDQDGGKMGISLFEAQIRQMPYTLDLMERHPLGSQAFIPMSQSRFLVAVADDDNGVPVNIRAFMARAGQGVNLHRNVWHGVLCPLDGNGVYAVIDRIGEGKNLEEHILENPFVLID